MKTKVIHSESAYHHTQNFVNKTKTDVFIHPVVWSVLKDGTPTFHWSSCNNRGHFGIPKIIWGWGSGGGLFIDREGQYGLTQFCSAITDEPENLDQIVKAMKTKEFRKLMKAVSTSPGVYNRRIIAELKHDFWREFV